MIIRSKAPLRIGFTGGGTDLESFSRTWGGAVFSATISMYAYCTIIPTDNGEIQIYSADNRNNLRVKSVPELPMDGNNLILHRGVYNRIVRDFHGGRPLSFIMSTSNDAPAGSGLGSSSTMIVAILQAFSTWLGLDLSLHGMASLAYDIERRELGLAGGRQDQYSAVFGGFNLFEFQRDQSVAVHPLVLPSSTVNELECSLLLYYSGRSRHSEDQQLQLVNRIIHSQISRTRQSQDDTLQSLQRLKENAYRMRDAVAAGNIPDFVRCLQVGWEEKKKTSDIISNAALEETIRYAMQNGAEAAKVSGAGGGGFLLLYCDPMHRQQLIDALKAQDGMVSSVRFSRHGAESWIV